MVFLSIFTKSQASSPFEAMNSAQLSMFQKDVRPSVQKRWRTMAFSRVSTGDSVISSSCDLRNMYVRGTLCFLPQVEWTPRCPYSKEGRISLQWLKCRLNFHLTRGRDVCIPCGDPRESNSSQPLLDRGPHSVSGNLWIFVKDVKTLVVYDVE